MALRDFEKQERMRQARRRQAAQRNRAGRLRGRVVAASLICFAVLWGVVFAQMATGNDPVLGEKTAAATSKAGRHSAAATRPRRQPVETEVETAPEAEFEVEPEAEPQPEFEPEPEPQPEVQPEAELQPEAEVEAQPEAELEPLTTSQS